MGEAGSVSGSSNGGHWGRVSLAQQSKREGKSPTRTVWIAFPHKNGAWPSILGLADPSAVGNPSLAGGSYLEVTG